MMTHQNKTLPGEADQQDQQNPGQTSEDLPDSTRHRDDSENRRESVVDRRSGVDRRDRRAGASPHAELERRRGPGRRRSDQRRSAEEGEMTDEQFEFIMAIEEYKKLNKKMFPTWTEVLEVIKYLGYHKDDPAEHQQQQ